MKDKIKTGKAEGVKFIYKKNRKREKNEEYF